MKYDVCACMFVCVCMCVYMFVNVMMKTIILCANLQHKFPLKDLEFVHVGLMIFICFYHPNYTITSK